MGSVANVSAEQDAPVFLIQLVAFVVGAIVMSFEMLGSRYLNPFFGSGIYTWASLISTVLSALAVGYFVGGRLADRRPRMAVLSLTVVLGSAYLLLLPLFADKLLTLTLAVADDPRAGSLIAATALMFVPVSLLGMYSPFAVRLVLRSTHDSGSVAGAIYGVSTVGSIVGTLGTTFLLIPVLGSRALTATLGIVGLVSGLFLLLPRNSRRLALAALAVACALLFQYGSSASAADAIDRTALRDVLKLGDGPAAHIESEYNDIFINKRGTNLGMSFRRYGNDYTESVSDLSDLSKLPVPYTRTMMIGMAYPPEPKSLLLIGLGGGSMIGHLAHFVPALAIDVVELDPAVIAAAGKYFGLRQTDTVRLIASDGRVYLNKNKKLFDVIMIDAFRGGYVPFHLLTEEFYQLLKERLTLEGVAVFNVHSGTKLYGSVIATLAKVFPVVDLYLESGNVIAVASAGPRFADKDLEQRAAAAQGRYKFTYALPTIAQTRTVPSAQLLRSDILTDDFAPVDLYNSIETKNQRQW